MFAGVIYMSIVGDSRERSGIVYGVLVERAAGGVGIVAGLDILSSYPELRGLVCPSRAYTMSSSVCVFTHVLPLYYCSLSWGPNGV